MNELNIAVYAEGCLYPAESAVQPVEDAIRQLQQSGFTTAILSLFHIGRDYAISPLQIMGDLYFNDSLVISQGRYVGDPNWPELVNAIPAGSVTRLCASIGGGSVMDFATIRKIYEQNGNSFSNTNLVQSFQTLRRFFPAISTVDMDCEDAYDAPSFVAFCQMLIGLGYDLTFCPYASRDFWCQSLAALHASSPGAVKWWNLQCYDGGGGNDPAAWAAAITAALPGFPTAGFIVAGDWTEDAPRQVQQLLAGFPDKSSIGGGFIWTLDDMLKNGSLANYASAIRSGLG